MAGMTADEVYVLLGDEITLLTEEVKQMKGWEPIEHKGTVQTAEDLPADAKKGWMYNIATDSAYGAAGMNVVMTSKGWDPMGPIINMNLYLTKEEGTKSFQPKGNYLSGTDTDLKESGKAADAKVTGEKIAKNSSDIAKKLGKNQGSENSGKVAGINEVGDIVPMFPMGVEYNSETNCLEFGSDQKMKLNQGIGLDNTLTKSGSAADAGVTGKKINSLKEDITSKADKTALAQTDRKLDALWKLNQGISYEFQTDEIEAYQKTVPSGAKVASIKSIGGKTLVWNQLLANISFDNVIWNSLTINGNSKDGITITGTASTNNNKNIGSVNIIKNHKYLVYGIDKSIILTDDDTFSTQAGNRIFTATNSKQSNISFYVKESSKYNTKNYPMLFDLTQMFGSGNEPSTPEEFEAMFPSDYYPYNSGELMSAPVNEVVEQGTNLLDIENRTDANPVNNWPIDTYDLGHVIYRGFAHSGYLQKDKNNVCDVEINNNTITISVKVVNYGIGYIMKCEPNTDYVISVDTTLILATILINKEGKKINTAYGTKIATDSDTHYLIICFGGKPAGTYTISNLRVNKGTTAIAYSPYHKTTCPIPQAILNLPGYGWSTGNVRNEADFENKKYIQRVGKYVITDSETFMTTYMPVITFLNKRHLMKRSVKAINNQGLSIFSANEKGDIWQFSISDIGLDEDATVDDIKEWFKVHPATVYYPMLNEEIIDISDIIGNTFQEPLEVEAGGTLMFKNSHGDNYRIPVSSTEEYLVSLAEVAK